MRAFLDWLLRLFWPPPRAAASIDPPMPTQAPTVPVAPPVALPPPKAPPTPPVAKPPVVASPKPKPVVSTVGPQSLWWKGRYPITQPWGCTSFATEGHNPNHPECAYFHEGIDFGLPCGTPLYAPIPLHVASIDKPGWGGASLELGDYDQTIWLMHMHDYAVKVGDHVHPGQLLGHSGTRGNSTGCHLHFMVIPAGKGYRQSINPAKFL